MKNWKRTKRVIVKQSKDLRNGPAQPTVQYRGEGTVYTYTSAVKQKPYPKVGTEVNLKYHPYRYEKAVMDTFVQRGSLFTLIGLIIIDPWPMGTLFRCSLVRL